MGFFKSLMIECGAHMIDDSDEELDLRIKDAHEIADGIFYRYYAHSSFHDWGYNSTIDASRLPLRKSVRQSVRKTAERQLKACSVDYLVIKDMLASYFLLVNDVWAMFFDQGGRVELERRYAIEHGKDRCDHYLDSFAEKLLERYAKQSDLNLDLVLGLNGDKINYLKCVEIDFSTLEDRGRMIPVLKSYSRKVFECLYDICCEETFAKDFYFEADFFEIWDRIVIDHNLHKWFPDSPLCEAIGHEAVSQRRFEAGFVSVVNLLSKKLKQVDQGMMAASLLAYIYYSARYVDPKTRAEDLPERLTKIWGTNFSETYDHIVRSITGISSDLRRQIVADQDLGKVFFYYRPELAAELRDYQGKLSRFWRDTWMIERKKEMPFVW